MKSRASECGNFDGHRCTVRNPRTKRPYKYCTPNCSGRKLVAKP